MTTIRPRYAARAAAILFAGVLAAGLAQNANALVLSGTSSSFGESVDLTGTLSLSLLAVSSGPLPTASGSAHPPYSDSNSALSAAASASVLGASFGLTTGILDVNASSNVDGSPGSKSASADATVNGLAVDLSTGVVAAISLLSFDATTIASTAGVTGDFGALIAAGTTTIEGATLTVGGIAVAVGLTPAANTVAFDALGLEVLLNEQIVGGDGIGSRSLTVNAIHILFDDFLIGDGVLNGDIIISQSNAALAARPSPTTVPLPGTFYLFAAGLMMLGVLRRRVH